MAETTQIDIRFRPDESKKLIIPERIRVPQNSIIRWNLIDLDEYPFHPRYFRRGLRFTVYFEKTSPFPWTRETTQIFAFPDFYPSVKNIKLAQGEAEKKGEYKYGVVVTDAQTEEPIYDEDPLIIVY